MKEDPARDVCPFKMQGLKKKTTLRDLLGLEEELRWWRWRKERQRAAFVCRGLDIYAARRLAWKFSAARLSFAPGDKGAHPFPLFRLFPDSNLKPRVGLAWFGDAEPPHPPSGVRKQFKVA